MNGCYIDVRKIHDKLAKVTLNRAEKHNALNLEMISELCQAFETLESTRCSVVLLEAKGKTFCSGMDLDQAADDGLIETMANHLAKLFTILNRTPLVTIAVVHGHAIAGGGGLAASCDLSVMAKEAKIGFPEVRRGLVAAQVAAVLMRQLNSRQVRGLLLTGELIDSQRALEVGLVNSIVPFDAIQQEALRLAELILKGAPQALKETKKLLDQLEPGKFNRNLELAVSCHHQSCISSEGKEGIAAFLEKRSPKWSK